MKDVETSTNLNDFAAKLRLELEEKKFLLLYGCNGIGKTRLSAAFKDLGKVLNTNAETIEGDTLYFNAFTEDLFTWNNDLEYDQDRFLILNTTSRFFEALEEYEIETRIRTILDRYADFDFEIILDTDSENEKLKDGRIVFSRDVITEVHNVPRLEKIEGIKVSRSEESIFVWCFFVAILELAIDPDIEAYDWVKYLYIDDPISSLDDQNAVQGAPQLEPH
ncbi:MAG: anticodon nuclease, partial [Gammaproteobacteria bacterium]|nr:anticodon nuclease [Gammaproteobacteria bacterium]